MPRIFPWLYDLVMGGQRSRLAVWRSETVRPATGLVLEIACGTGLDFAYYRHEATVIATEPNLGMLRRARERAAAASATVLLVAADAQALPFRDCTFDTAVVGLALCTIPSPARALAELRRVLRAGGIARFLEHVRIDRPIIGRLQDLLTPIWQRVAGGCRLNECTLEAIQDAGFQVDDVHPHLKGLVLAVETSVPSASAPPHIESVVPHVCGYIVELVGRSRGDEGSRLATEDVRDQPPSSCTMCGPSPSPSARG